VASIMWVIGCSFDTGGVSSVTLTSNRDPRGAGTVVVEGVDLLGQRPVDRVASDQVVQVVAQWQRRQPGQPVQILSCIGPSVVGAITGPPARALRAVAAAVADRASTGMHVVRLAPAWPAGRGTRDRSPTGRRLLQASGAQSAIPVRVPGGLHDDAGQSWCRLSRLPQVFLVVDEDADEPYMHHPRPLLWSLGQLAVLTALRCYLPGTVAGSAPPSESPGSCQRLDRGQSRPAALAGWRTTTGPGGAACWAAPGGMPAP
jgi:hypothetical protein